MSLNTRRARISSAAAVLMVLGFLCLPLSASAEDQVEDAVEWSLNMHATTGGPLGCLALSMQLRPLSWLVLEAGGGYDTQLIDFESSLRAGGRVHVIALSLGQSTRFSMGLFAGLGYDSLETESSGSVFSVNASEGRAFKHLTTVAAGPTLELFEPASGLRLGFEVGVVTYLGAAAREGVADDGAAQDPDALPGGRFYGGLNLGVVF